jgi:hypothetical protein
MILGRLLLDTKSGVKDPLFPDPDIGDAVHLSMLMLSGKDRRCPQNWGHYMVTGLWVNTNGVIPLNMPTA